MPDVRAYLQISFIGSAFIVGPMVAGNILRALGDARIPSMTMVAGAIINLVLDPFLIFGIGPSLGWKLPELHWQQYCQTFLPS